MRLIDAYGSYTINANDNTDYSLCFGGGIISVADERGHILAEFDADDAPTIDPESLRPHGRWEKYFEGKYIMCSACKASFWSEDGETTNYCQNCGAKMDLEDGETNGEKESL